jgi:hypothetical protein
MIQKSVRIAFLFVLGVAPSQSTEMRMYWSEEAQS